jgi:hypothetical protein
MYKILVIRLYFHYTLYMFRTVLVHLQEQTSYKLYVIFGIIRYVWLLCYYRKDWTRRILYILLVYIHIQCGRYLP